MIHPNHSRVRAALTLVALFAAVPLPAQRAAVEAPHGVVTSVHELASAAGVQILQQGGNAVDAAVATGLVLAVVYPFAGNLTGGGFMVVHLAPHSRNAGFAGTDVVIDYRETAPAAASRDMYLAPDGTVRQGPGSSTVGWRASGVPGTIAGFALAWEKYGSGRISWTQLCEPARRLAADGHRVSPATARSLREYAKFLAECDETRRIYLHGGTLLQPGELWRQPELAGTLARLEQDGPREFYEGETARRIDAAMRAAGGTITLEDLRRYRAVERAPLRGVYRGYEIVTMPPPSSGGIALLQMLTMMEPFDVHSLGYNSAAKYHLLAEVMKRAFRDRAEYLGDPDFVHVPVERLLDAAYLKRRMADYDPKHATPVDRIAPGLGPLSTISSALPSSAAGESTETTHYSIVDADGNAVSNTYTLNGAYGSGVTIPGTGLLMNNEMDDFTAKVGVKNMFGLLQGPANAIMPNKRPLSSMAPTMVFKNHELVLVTGSPGGPTIINTVLEVVSNIIDHQMPVERAVEAPRVHHQWMPDVLTYESWGLSPDTTAILTAEGYTLQERHSYEGGYQGDAETVAIDPATKLRLGAADPRKPDAKAIGY